MLTIGSIISVKGFITDEKFIRGQTLSEIEKRLGFHQGRLKKGAMFALVDYPNLLEFNLRGYSQVAGHHFDKQYGHIQIDVGQAKKSLLKSWQNHKVQLIKVRPFIDHNSAMDDDKQYPPGSGVPQWQITQSVKGRVIAIYDANAYHQNIPYQRMQYLHNQIN
ncbi:MAG: hypothetical protein RIG62_14815 [Cyclobacteriaceae bacterium]